MSASLFSRLEPFDCQRGDFDYYLEQFDNYLLLNSVQDPVKTVPLFISSIGQDAYKILREICDPVDPKEKPFEELKSLLQEYFARRTFYGRSQRQGEYTGAYINELKRLVAKCNFGPFGKEALRDRIACGKLPEDKNNSIDKNQPPAEQKQKASAAEATSSQKQKKTPKQPAATGVEVAVPGGDQKQQKGPKGQQQQQHKCKICGHLHQENECPHKDASCHKCRKKGHIALVCREKAENKNKQQQQQQPVQVHVHVQQNTGVKN